MDTIIRKIQDTSNAFILSERGYAQHELGELINLLLENKTKINEPSRLLPILSKLMTAQKTKNYLYIADLLTYELLPLLVSSPLH